MQNQTQPRGLRYGTLTHYFAIKRSLIHGQDLNSTKLLRSSCRVLCYDVRALDVSKEHTASIYRAEIKAEATRSTATLVPTCHTTRRHSRENHKGNLHRCENRLQHVIWRHYFNCMHYALNAGRKTMMTSMCGSAIKQHLLGDSEYNHGKKTDQHYLRSARVESYRRRVVPSNPSTCFINTTWEYTAPQLRNCEVCCCRGNAGPPDLYRTGLANISCPNFLQIPKIFFRVPTGILKRKDKVLESSTIHINYCILIIIDARYI